MISFNDIADKLSSKKILVIGDLILDEYLWGETSRISPEAPVPIIDVNDEEHRLGGAANVVSNLVAFGCTPYLCGVVGYDTNGDIIRKMVAEMNTSTTGITNERLRPTTVKTRVIAQSQQLIRIDRETKAPIDSSTIRRLLGAITAAVGDADAIIISDYGKGVITKQFLPTLLPIINKRGIPVVVDPVAQHMNDYRGVTCITPNHLEAMGAVDVNVGTASLHSDDVISTIGDRLLESTGSASILITRGKDGMTLLENTPEVTHIPTVAKEVCDVSGAGDTVIATIAVALANGASLVEAATIANHTAGIVVGKSGTATASIKEIKATFNEED